MYITLVTLGNRKANIMFWIHYTNLFMLLYSPISKKGLLFEKRNALLKATLYPSYSFLKGIP